MKFRNSGPLPSEDQLRELESEFRISLPSAYREFLLTINGGYPEGDYFEAIDGSVFVLQRLWVLGTDPPWDLAHRNRYFDNRPKFFEIGFSICGDPVAIDLKGRQRGRVVWFDHEVDSGLFRRRDLRLLSNSFSELIDGLYADYAR
jgi:SMI1 / KNR4 family (SUKH-1)